MSLQKKTSIAFLSISMCVSAAHKVLADNNFFSKYSQDQIRDSIFKRLDVQKAISNFCRSIQLDPRNKTALENFEYIAGSSDLSAQQRSDVILIQNLMENIKNLNRRIDHFKELQTFLKDQLISQGGHSAAMLNVQLLAIKGDYYHSDVRGLERGGVYAYSDKSFELLKRILNEKKEDLYTELQYVNQQHEWLTVLLKGEAYLPEIDTANEITFDAVSSQNLIIENKSLMIVAQEVDKVKGQNIDVVDVVSSEIKEVKVVGQEEYSDIADSDELKKILIQRDASISSLSEEVVDLSLKFSELEFLLSEKMEEIFSLRKQLVDVEQRFMLEKRIIQEKDSEIQVLQDSLDQSRSETRERSDKIVLPRDEKLNELKGILEIYKYKLGEKNGLTKQKAKDILVLKKRLEILQLELNEKKNVLEKTQSDLKIFKKHLTKVEFDVLDLKKLPIANGLQVPDIEQKVSQLQSQVNDIQHFLLENLHDSDKMNTHLTIQ